MRKKSAIGKRHSGYKASSLQKFVKSIIKAEMSKKSNKLYLLVRK